MRFGYLVSRYPAISHSFILREVLALRTHGIELEIASVNSPDRAMAELTQDEQKEAARTFYIKQSGWAGAIAAQALLLLKYPVRYFRGLTFALKLAKTDLSRIFLCFFYFIEASMLARWMRQRSIDHLHVHFATPAATVALILTRLAPVGFSITVHGPDEFFDVPGYFLREKIADARFICAIGQYAKSQLMRFSAIENWGKFEVAPLGVDSMHFAARPFRLAPPTFEVLCVGRLVAAKGQHVLLAAAARLTAEGRNVLFRFVGDGPDRASLVRQTQRLGLGSSVRFEGAVDQESIRGLYERADVFALASFAEGIPVVLMEAMAMEIPCVTTWITGIPELIRNEIDGLLVAPSDAAGMAAAIARLMDNSELRKQIGERGRKRILEKYDLSTNVAHLANVFEQRLGAHA